MSVKALENTLRTRLKEIFDLMRRMRELIAELEDAQYPGAPHAASHANGGPDQVDVTDLGGFPGGGTTFLRDDGTFAAAGAGTPSATVEDLDGTGDAGVSTDYSRGDHKHADTNRPTDDEKAALAGTGTPSAANPYVTDDTLGAHESDTDAHKGQKNSIELDAGDLQLVGDDAAPGANQVYGTDGSGNKGWKADPSGGSGITELTGDVTAGPGSGSQAATIPNGTVTPAKQSTAARTRVITFVIDGGGATITTGVKGDLYVPFSHTITEVTLLADQSGAIVVDIWHDSYANYPPTDSPDSITASAPPTITASGDKSQDTTLTGWTTSISAGTYRFNVDSVTSIQRVTVALTVLMT